jgi:hypothetical protein
MSVFLVLILYTLISGLLLSNWVPWWSYVPVSTLIAFLLARTGTSALLAGFLAAFLPWIATIAYLDTLSDGRMTDRVASIFGLNSSFSLMIMGALIGGLLGGWGAWIGWLLRWSFRSRKR